MKSAIVSGANGFVGSAVVKYLLSKNIHVCALVHNGNASRLCNLPNLEIISCDISNIDELENIVKKKYDVFYHFAWTGSAGSQRSDYGLQLDNVKWSLNAMRLAKKIGCTRFIFAGTIMEDEIFEATHFGDIELSMSYIYGAGKIAAHLMALPLAVQLGIELIWAKITNTYGPGEDSPRLVNTTINKCIAGISPEFTSGTQNYDFIYIDDVAESFYDIGKNGKPFSNYIIGSGSAKPLKEFLLEMQGAISPELEYKFGNVPYTGVNLPLEVFSTRNLEEDTGFKAKVSFQEGCVRTRDWLKRR